MAQIIFELALNEDEKNLVSSLKHHLNNNSYPDVRDFVVDLVDIIHNHTLSDRFMIGTGSSHIWIKRQSELVRWAIVTE